MKRLPVFFSLIAVLALSASLAYWAMQLLKPLARPIAPAPVQSAPSASLQAAATLFGGQSVAIAASNYQLTGVVAAGNGRRSAAIMVIDGKAPQAVPVGRAIASGILLAEVHPKYVLLSEGGIIKRVELDANPKGAGAGMAAGTGLLIQAPVNLPPALTPPDQMPSAQMPSALTPPAQMPPAQMTSQPGAVVVQPQAGADR
jgi:general secretion pathway protein C